MGAVFFLFKRGNMGKNREKTDDFAPNPLVESGVGKMIQVIRGKQVLLDRDLATLYGVETKRINEQVKRNIERFPEDFCIQLSLEESQLLRSQNATIEKKGQNLKGKHTKYRSLAFTEQGVAMLSAVLDTIFEAMDRGELKSKGLYYNNSVHRRYGLPLRGFTQGPWQEYVLLYARRFHVARSAEGIAENSGRKRKPNTTE
ncbi:ORF6N domain-containing protein [Fibrobacter sp.]